MNRFILFALLFLAGFAQAAQVNCTLPTKRVDGTPFAPSEVAYVSLWSVRADGTKNSRMISWPGPTCGGTYNNFVIGRNYALVLTDKSTPALNSSLSQVFTYVGQSNCQPFVFVTPSVP